MALPPLNVLIGADTSGLDSALGRARRGLGGLAVAAGAAGLAVAAGLTAMTRAGLAAIDAQQKLARSIDGTVNGLRAVQIAAGYAGVSVGEANTSLQQMNREIARAANETGPAREALARLGLAASDFSNIDTDQRAALIADRVRQLGLSSGQASNLLRDLGMRSRNMALLMIQGGDAIRSARQEVRDFGLELSQEQTGAIEAANDAIARMGLVFEGLRNRLAVEVAPALQAAADRFNALAQSANVQAAIERLSQAFGGLANVILSEDFIGAAIAGLETLARVASSVAEGMVFLSQNMEMVTAAFSVLAIAAAALGGPLWIIGGALAAALVGISSIRARSVEAAGGLDAAQAATNELNRALGVFAETGAPSAQREAVTLARRMEAEALAALSAAQAHRELALARVQALEGFGDGGESNPAIGGVRRDLDEAEARVMQVLEQLDNARRSARMLIMEVGGGQGGGTTPSDDEPDVPIIPGVAGSNNVRAELEARLQAVQQGLMTEAETVAAWHDGALQTLRDARDVELLTEAEYNEASERLEQEHQERLAAIRNMGNENALSSIIGTGQEILGAIGQNNKRAMAAAQALGQFEALVNAYRAASQVLADRSLPWFAKVAAAGSVLASGIGFANAIKGMSGSGSTGGGSAGAAAGSSAGAGGGGQNIYLNVQPNARGDIPMQTFRGVVDSLNDQLNRGGRIVA